ncbi:hypothetical protein PanWU01x14_239050 [Parasponia andersonii]|uniref:Uncharacterized protein n=1 Tax=Parasponia andersonii TaxID=3476 RepID=A0A2P5BHI5_PARAD|nr:hypothetical protein PanWU01x14_239050 [Parasponia andersonii]
MKCGGRRLVVGEQDEANSAMESFKLALEAMLNATDLIRTIVELKITESEVAKIQESIVEPLLLEIINCGGRRLVDEEQDEVDSAIESLKLALEVMLNAVNLLRTIVEL